MRFMLLMIPNIPEEDWTPSADDVAEMMAYNEQLTKAGVLLALDGLHPSAKGARVTSSQGRKTVTDGPFTEAKVSRASTMRATPSGCAGTWTAPSGYLPSSAWICAPRRAGPWRT